MVDSEKRRIVRDQLGAEYRLTGKLGEGGQGIVCTTDRNTVLVKLFTDRDEDRQRHWVNRLNWVLNQELDGLRIARPLALIERPHPGYVMELMDGLEPLQSSLESSLEALRDGKGLSGYNATGGLRRRLALLRELAATLAGLHARGLVYGDLSPANVFVSRSVDHCQVWLIDCDNLCAAERFGHVHLYTPGYGAPEVVRGERGVNSLTDAWSFAVLVFQLLTHRHPLMGETLLAGEPELQERALRGEFPWVHHPEDRTNQDSGALPLDLVATSRLQVLFEDCFNAGRDDPLARPSLAEWMDALEGAWALMLDCDAPDCGSSFFWNDARRCPFCDHVLKEGLLLEHAWYSEETPEQPYLDTGDRAVLGSDRSLSLHLAPVGTLGYRDAPLVCTLSLDATGLQMDPEHDAEVTLLRLNDGKMFSFTQAKRLKPQQRSGMALALILGHAGEPRLHPLWRFIW